MSIVRRLFSALALVVMSPAAQAEDHPANNKLCSELQAEVQEFLSQNPNLWPGVFADESPMMIIFDQVLGELNFISYWRIRHELEDYFHLGCIEPTDHILAVHKKRGLPDDPTAGQVVDSLVEFWGLDRSLPRWGLAELPALDFEIHSRRYWDETYFSLPDEVRNHPYNHSYFDAKYREYLLDFDVSTLKAIQASRVVHRMITSNYGLDATDYELPIKTALDRLAAEHGLKRR